MPTPTHPRTFLQPPAHPGLPADFPAPWASDWGEDEYGLWMSFSYQGIRQALRWIQPGEFVMGSPQSEREPREDETQHRVILTRKVSGWQRRPAPRPCGRLS